LFVAQGSRVAESAAGGTLGAPESDDVRPQPAPSSRASSLYWFLPLALALVQYVYLRPTLNFIRYEEMAESVRNVYWLRDHALFDKRSCNIGWYAVMLFLYDAFGFSLHLARYFRVALQLLSLLCLAGLLKKHLGERRALLPLLVCGLSPTWLYFSLLECSLALDLQVLPICLWLLDRVEWQQRKPLINSVLLAAAWSIAMWAWLCYPAFAVLLPALGLFCLHRLWPLFPARQWRLAALFGSVSLASFLLPLAAAFAYVDDRAVLWSGVFRGGGGAPRVGVSSLVNTVHLLIVELFSRSISYYFHLPEVEFSRLYPIVAVVAVLILSLVLLVRAPSLRLVLGCSWLVLLLTLILASLGTHAPGLRRETAILAAFYSMFIAGFAWCLARAEVWVRALALGAAGLLLVHHAWALPKNIFPHSAGNPMRDAGPDPQGLMQQLSAKVQSEDLTLRCRACRYSEIYAALEGGCAWNHLSCHDIYGEDKATHALFRLSIPALNALASEHDADSQ